MKWNKVSGCYDTDKRERDGAGRVLSSKRETSDTTRTGGSSEVTRTKL